MDDLYPLHGSVRVAKLPLKHSIASIVDGDVLVLLAVLRELGQYVWKTHIPHRLKQSGDAISAFSPTGLVNDCQVSHSIWHG